MSYTVACERFPLCYTVELFQDAKCQQSDWKSPPEICNYCVFGRMRTCKGNLINVTQYEHLDCTGAVVKSTKSYLGECAPTNYSFPNDQSIRYSNSFSPCAMVHFNQSWGPDCSGNSQISTQMSGACSPGFPSKDQAKDYAISVTCPTGDVDSIRKLPGLEALSADQWRALANRKQRE